MIALGSRARAIGFRRLVRLSAMMIVVVSGIAVTTQWSIGADDQEKQGGQVVLADSSSEITYADAEVARYCEKFHIGDDRQYSRFHFPAESFLEGGYAPPGGYVKDFSIIKHDDRYHLFHIDGRPEERCGETGNEISFGHASTADFRHWIRHRMPLAVSEKPWECDHVWAPYVYKRGDTFYMFYMGSGPGGTFVTYATSPDLEKWTRWPDGPIKSAIGRDPMAYTDGDRTIMIYTAHKRGTVGAVASNDMQTWEALPDLINNPDRACCESSSMHPLGNGYVLWFNDYYHCGDASGDFRACYVLSDKPDHFDPAGITIFDFHTSLPTKYEFNDWIEKRPIPVSIELVEKYGDAWLVCYFRWHNGRFRLFFGSLDWTRKPARITEINSAQQLEATLLRKK